MSHTVKQHVMPQWVLRNFRSDDTAHAAKEKKRVWCHTVYPGESERNSIREISLSIASVGVAKNCFSLSDGDTGELFDIEKELGEYELRTSEVFNCFVRDHDFASLLQVGDSGSHIETVVNFMVIQMILNLHNPQNKNSEKELVFSRLVEGLDENYLEIKKSVVDMPEHVRALYGREFSEKIIRAVNSSSERAQICKVLFVLFALAEAKGLPILAPSLSILRKGLFSNIYIEGIYHTGYSLDSTDVRPVFVIGPNVFSSSVMGGDIYLPIAHNLAFGFSVRRRSYYNSEIFIYSARPEILNIPRREGLKIFRVSHDFIDGVVCDVLAGANSMSNTIYTPHELSDVEKYLDLQRKDEDYFYEPKHPEIFN